MNRREALGTLISTVTTFALALLPGCGGGNIITPSPEPPDPPAPPPTPPQVPPPDPPTDPDTITVTVIFTPPGNESETETKEVKLPPGSTALQAIATFGYSGDRNWETPSIINGYLDSYKYTVDGEEPVNPDNGYVFYAGDFAMYKDCHITVKPITS